MPKLDRDIADLRSRLFGRVEEVQDGYQAKGWLPARLNLNKGIVRGLLELFSWGLWQLYNFLARVHRQAIPLDSDGEWLDLHCAQVDVTRKPATKARGDVLFHRSGARGNVRIPAGRIVRTKPDGNGRIYRYATLADAVLPENSDSMAVAVEAEDYGQLANATTGQICELATPVVGIGGVDNQDGWLTAEGADEESDISLRRRYVLAWKRRAGVTRSAYEAAALEVAGVSDVYVADQHPRGEGTVDVIVCGAAGMPTQSLLDAVRASLDEYIVINHDLLVKAPQPVPVDVKFTLELLSGDEGSIRREAENWVRAMFSPVEQEGVPRFAIGKDVVRDRLAAGIVDIPGVKRIVWESPAADVEVPVDGLAILNSLEAGVLWVEQP